MENEKKCFAFTGELRTCFDRIVSRIHVANPACKDDMKSVRCMWDTGASLCVISKSLFDRLRLEANGSMKVHGAFGRGVCVTSKAMISVCLEGYSFKQDVVVDEHPMADDDYDIILGMDFISRGDFAITHKDGHLLFSFCYPPQAPVDFGEIMVEKGMQPAYLYIDRLG